MIRYANIIKQLNLKRFGLGILLSKRWVKKAYLLKPFFAFLTLFFAGIFTGHAQTPLPQSFLDSLGIHNTSKVNCGTDIMLDNLRKNPSYRALEEQMNDEILRMQGMMSDDTITVPVVVHIVNMNPYGISDAQVLAGIQNLNDAFSKSGPYSASAGADTKIRFCLAKTDPDGGITNGITRTKSFYANSLNKDIEDARLKNLIQWDPAHYVNIWLIQSIESEAYASFSCGSWYRLRVGGYATLPPGGGSLDGIVVTGFGALLAHEMGHYLGLYHTFEGGCSNYDCTTNGDRVCDTPPDNSVRPSVSCSIPENSCSTDTLSSYSNGFFTTDVPDQIANFMDYGNGGCSNQFTQGQADRMRAAILTQRAGLLVNKCDPPCVENIVAGFTRDIDYSVIGNTITFTNTSTGATNYEWLVNDVVVSTNVDYTHTFNDIGKDKITLKAFNSPGCFASSTAYVITGCGVSARFFTDKQAIASTINIYEDSIKFTNTSVNGTSFQWLMSNDKGMTEQVISTDVNFTYIFPVAGNYAVRLIATNGTCSDTTGIFRIPVADPTSDADIFASSFTCFGGNQVKVDFCIADYGYASIPKGVPVSFYDADPRKPGANKLPSTMYLNRDVPGGNCYVCFSHVLNIPYKGLSMVYVAVNDSGNVTPLVLPNTPLVEKNYSNNIVSAQIMRTTVRVSICDGQNYSGHTKTGTYIDTLVSKITGCDSIRTLILQVNPVPFTTVTTEICAGENYAGHTTTGTYVDVYKTVAGCDSTRTLYLTVKPTPKTVLDISICDGESFEGYTKSGDYVDVFKAANGCDSTRTLHLTVKPRSFTTIDISICQGESYFVAGDFQTKTGTYYDTLLNHLGCDSIITTKLTVHPLPQPDLGEDRGICMGDILILDPGSFSSYLWHDGSTDNTFSTTAVGHYSVEVTSMFGCKNKAEMNVLRIDTLPVNFLRSDTSLCRGNVVVLKTNRFDKYFWSTGETVSYINVTATGMYKLDAIDRNGCKGADSVYIDFYDCKDVWIPNAFTPNVDGLNDIFRPVFPAPVKNYLMTIRNRYGQKIFETTNLKAGWDGRFRGADQPVGVYVYVMSFIDVDGNPVMKKGTIRLIR